MDCKPHLSVLKSEQEEVVEEKIADNDFQGEES